jgi:glycosyltransferase involved in cell wall biosynthesis
VTAPPDVSVVIPTLNRQAALARSISITLGQENVNLEVIVVDDGSTDSTPAYLKTGRDPQLQVIRHARRTGVAAARNHGIQQARGEWVAFLDDDDVWAPHKLREQVSTALARIVQ